MLSTRMLRLASFFFLLSTFFTFNADRRTQAQSTVSVTAAQPTAGATPGVFTITRTGDTSRPLLVTYNLGGAALYRSDYAIDSNGIFSLSAPFAPGKVGRAFNFTGFGSEAVIPASPNWDVTKGSGFTIDLWVKPYQVNARHTLDALLSWRTSAPPDPQWRQGTQFFINGGDCGGDGSGLGNISIDFNDPRGSTPCFGTVSGQFGFNGLTEAEWQHIAVTYDNATYVARVYRNGQIALETTVKYQGGSPANIVPQTLYDLHLGAGVQGGRLDTAPIRRFEGQLDEVHVYNRALTQAEIQSIYNADSAGVCKAGNAVPNCVAPPAGMVAWVDGDNNVKDLISGNVGTFVTEQLYIPAGQSSVNLNVRATGSAGSNGKMVTLALTIDSASNFSGSGNNGSLYIFDQQARLATVTLSGVSSPPGTLSSITPTKGGDGGAVTATVYGVGIPAGATAKLVRAGQADITGTQIDVSPDGVSLTATFDLTGKAQGAYDVVVTNADGTARTLAGAFTVEQAKPAILNADLIARDVIRIGNEYPFFVLYGNSGNNDVTDARLYVSVPDYVTLTPDTNLSYQLVHIIGRNYIKFILPKVRAGSDQSPDVVAVKVKITDPNQIHQKFETSVSIVNQQAINSLSATAQSSTQIARSGNNDVHPKLVGVLTEQDCNELVVQLNLAAEQHDSRALRDILLQNLAVTAEGGIPPLEQCQDIYDQRIREQRAKDDSSHDIYRVLSLIDSEIYAHQHGPNGGTDPRTPNDPNEKDGPGGVGAPGYITGKTALPYAIYFENKDTAALPAQDVTVTDQLDPSKVDLSTFRFGTISFGSRAFTPPAGQTSFTSFVDLRPNRNLVLKITASLNATTGLVTWKFNSLDPATLQPPSDPQAGFLPPNKTSPQGQGGVTFTVMAKNSLQTNTAIANTARVVFDVNPPIDTPLVTNTIDKDAPTSQVKALAVNSPYSFVVNWSGADQGSGVSAYTLYASDNGGDYKPALITLDTSTVFTGQAGHTYRFYTLATDRVGNREGAKTQAEATTAVNAATGNAIDDPTFFVTQHYRDFLNRSPDAPGFNFWVNQIQSCNADTLCIDRKRVNTSGAYFISTEFQTTGYYAYRLYKGALNRVPTYTEFTNDVPQLSGGIVVNNQLSDTNIEANKNAFVTQFVTRPEFKAIYDPLSNAGFVDKLVANTGVTLADADRSALIAGLDQATETRASVLRKMLDGTTTTGGGNLQFTTAYGKAFYDKEYTAAFVLMQYFGYLRRDPDSAGYDFWLKKLNSYKNFIDAEMVRSFIVSDEYRKRFGLQ